MFDNDLDGRFELYSLLVVFVLAIFFGLFTLSILSQQVYMVANASSTIDTKTNKTRTREVLRCKIPMPDYLKTGMYGRFRDVMGYPLFWMFPVKFSSEISPEGELSQFYM